MRPGASDACSKCSICCDPAILGSTHECRTDSPPARSGSLRAPEVKLRLWQETAATLDVEFEVVVTGETEQKAEQLAANRITDLERLVTPLQLTTEEHEFGFRMGKLFVRCHFVQ